MMTMVLLTALLKMKAGIMAKERTTPVMKVTERTTPVMKAIMAMEPTILVTKVIMATEPTTPEMKAAIMGVEAVKATTPVAEDNHKPY